jgi:hypothetical protein
VSQRKKVLDFLTTEFIIGLKMKNSDLIAKVRKPTSGLLRPRKEAKGDRVKRENKKSRSFIKRLLRKGGLDE